MVIIDEDQLREIYNNLTQTEGWTLVETFIKGRIDYHKQQLITCALEEVTSHRDKIRAFDSVLYHVIEHTKPPIEAVEHP